MNTYIRKYIHTYINTLNATNAHTYSFLARSVHDVLRRLQARAALLRVSFRANGASVGNAGGNVAFSPLSPNSIHELGKVGRTAFQCAP